MLARSGPILQERNELVGVQSTVAIVVKPSQELLELIAANLLPGLKQEH
eukprot:CAMPEP_0194556472 /NCGR_PEP_ID=MMETSP0253-20130528/98760_1 /TAXON_ID=2966 /ORGANISM="Noctiluca scintillans" /LENGTH=48 /DNA_ID= /DNA_START= /DNA_END= /DNA_ORIENTATION=